MMEVSRGANLIGMSTTPLDACPLSLLIKKKLFIKYAQHDVDMNQTIGHIPIMNNLSIYYLLNINPANFTILPF